MDSLWIKKYCPTNLQNDKFYLYQPLFQKLISFCEDCYKNNINCGNIIISGQNGIGKFTLSQCIVNEIFKNKEIKYEISNLEMKNKSNKKIQFTFYSNLNCIIFDLLSIQNHISLFLRNYIKKFIIYKNIDSSNKIIIFRNSQLFNLENQQFLRRLLEKYSSYVSFILLTNSLNSLIEPLRSRCLKLTIKSYTINERYKFVRNIIKNEGFKVKKDNIMNLIKYTNDFYECNLKQLVNKLQDAYETKKFKIVNTDFEKAMIQTIFFFQERFQIYLDKKCITLFYKNKKFEKKEEYKKIFLEKGDKNFSNFNNLKNNLLELYFKNDNFNLNFAIKYLVKNLQNIFNYKINIDIITNEEQIDRVKNIIKCKIIDCISKINDLTKYIDKVNYNFYILENILFIIYNKIIN
jgi:DNA polymerase III delta prime subunit